MQRKIKDRYGERGNVLFMILIAIVLLAALTFSVSRSGRQSGGMEMEKAVIMANEILSYASSIEGAVNTLMLQGVLEGDLCFYSTTNHADYNLNAGCAVATNVVFGASSLKYQAPPVGANDGSEWYFTGETVIDVLGTAAPELSVLLQDVEENVCHSINNRLGHAFTGSIPDGLATFDTAARFAGTYSANETINASAETDGKSAFCFKETGTGKYHFIMALVAR